MRTERALRRLNQAAPVAAGRPAVVLGIQRAESRLADGETGFVSGSSVRTPTSRTTVAPEPAHG
jgi:hypothetical protein